MTQAITDQRSVNRLHGGLLLCALANAGLIDLFHPWPLYLLAPLAVYGAVVCAVPSLRRSADWLKLGCVDRTVATLTVLLAVAAPIALVCFDQLVHPSLAHLRRGLPSFIWEHPVVGGLAFSALNALLEEVVFRGVLQVALVSALGLVLGVLVQGVAFGLSHAAGYPPGATGVVLATIYGILLGVLKTRSRGLGAPIVAHFFADATIFAMAFRFGQET